MVASAKGFVRDVDKKVTKMRIGVNEAEVPWTLVQRQQPSAACPGKLDHPGLVRWNSRRKIEVVIR